jgi:hypothetical protein
MMRLWCELIELLISIIFILPFAALFYSAAVVPLVRFVYSGGGSHRMGSGCCSDDGIAAVGAIFGPSQGTKARAVYSGVGRCGASGGGPPDAGIGDIFTNSDQQIITNHQSSNLFTIPTAVLTIFMLHVSKPFSLPSHGIQSS